MSLTRVYKCPKCSGSTINMTISILTEQPIKYLRQLPRTLDISPDTSGMGAWVDWSVASFVCADCQTTYKDEDRFLVGFGD